MTLLFAFGWITKKIDGVFYDLFVFLFLDLLRFGVEGAFSYHSLRVCAGVCVLCTAAACGLCVCGLEWISVVSPDGTDMPPVCWCLSASCWNSTRFSSPSIWADEITRRKHTAPLVVVKTEDSLNGLFVFDQNHISHSLRWIYWYSLLQLSVG